MENSVENSRVKLLRIDAAWDNDRFLAEAETETGDGETRYALVTEENGAREYLVMSESEYDAVFCRTDGFRPGPEHVLERYASLFEARDAGSPYLEALGRLDDVTDAADKILDYRWQPEDDME